MKLIHTTTAALVLAAGAGLGAATPAQAAPCYSDDLFAWTNPIAATGTRQTIQMRSICPTASVTLQRADGTLRQTVRLTGVNETPDGFGTYGSFTAPVKNGAGTWMVTHLHDGSATRKLARPYTFLVQRATTFGFRELGWSKAGAAYTVTSRALYYTSTGGTAPHKNTRIDVFGMAYDGSPLNHLLATVRTDSSGIFRYTVRLPEEYVLGFRAEPANPVLQRGERNHVVLFRPAIDLTGYPARAVAGVPMTITGYAGPGRRTVGLRWDFLDSDDRFTDTGVRATTDTSGRFTLRFTPPRAGSARFLVSTPADRPETGDPYLTPVFRTTITKPSS